MLAAARAHRTAVVIGGGLLGLEAANGLQRQGMDVTVVHVSTADGPAARRERGGAPASALEAKGMRCLLEARHDADRRRMSAGRAPLLRGRHRDSRRPRRDGGRRAPNIELAKAPGLHCERAIVVDDTLQTYDPRVYAVGECVQHRAATFGLVAPIWDQARVRGRASRGRGASPLRARATATKLKVTGIDLYSAGDFIGGPGSEDLVLRDPRRGIYKRLVLRTTTVGRA